ncbi:MAG TPA: LLM class F420-dependent oxidoreductase [Methylomirabilota bacterium]|jgi:F420-dependent oxidoreductase-like protein|nr:LLM class F420-dependent oxidoreductase [Methylomirabilota bacterium]
MANGQISRRGFLRNVGAFTAAAALAGQLPRLTTARAESPAPRRLRFGVQTLPQEVSYQDIQRVWQEADTLGFDSVFLYDHFLPIYTEPTGPCLEGWTLLSALAAQTRNVRVGLLVTGNTYRNPAILAKMAATVDHISGGRLILGMGAGWFEREHAAYGVPFYSPGERARRLVEAVEIVKMLFTQEKTTYNGKYYKLQDAPFAPKPLQKPHPPILIGGMGPKVIQPLAARHADIWNFVVREGGPEAVKQIGDKFDALCRQVGRNPAEIEKSFTLRPPLLNQPSAEVRQQVQAYADAGVRYFIVWLPPPYDREMLRRFAKEVMPAFRET